MKPQRSRDLCEESEDLSMAIEIEICELEA